MLDEGFSVSPAYQQALEKGRQEGIAEGKAKTLVLIRQPIIRNIFDQFPSLTRFAKEILVKIDDPGLLYCLAVKLAQAQSTEEAHQILLKAQLAT